MMQIYGKRDSTTTRSFHIQEGPADEVHFERIILVVIDNLRIAHLLFVNVDVEGWRELN